jgi:hypothetical protein
MRNSVLASLLDVLIPPVPLLAGHDGGVLHVHLEHGEGLRDGADRMCQEGRPGRKKINEWRGAFEVGREGKNSEGNEYALYAPIC